MDVEENYCVPIFSLPTPTKKQAGDSNGGGRFFFPSFSCLGLPSIPTPQHHEVTPPLTLPRLFPVALSALIVADWLNVENSKMEGPWVGKKEKEGGFGDRGEKRGGRGGERPFVLFFH